MGNGARGRGKVGSNYFGVTTTASPSLGDNGGNGVMRQKMTRLPVCAIMRHCRLIRPMLPSMAENPITYLSTYNLSKETVYTWAYQYLPNLATHARYTPSREAYSLTFPHTSFKERLPKTSCSSMILLSAHPISAMSFSNSMFSVIS